MARSTLSDHIQEIRTIIGEEVSDFASDDIERILDRHRVRWFGVQCDVIRWKNGDIRAFVAPTGWIESNCTFRDGDDVVVNPTTADYKLGIFTFGAEVKAVYVDGYVYDIYGSAANCVQVIMARRKYEYRYSSARDTYERQQVMSHLKTLHDMLAGKSWLTSPQRI